MKSESTVDADLMRKPVACDSVDVASDLKSGRRDGDPPATTGPIGDCRDTPPYASIASGRYRVGRELGHGGMGIVFEAWDTQLDRPVAIKLLMPAGDAGDQPVRTQRFLREACIASRLNHTGVMAIHEFGTGEDGHSFIVMSLLNGHTLKDLLESRTDIAAELPRLLGVFLQVCQTIACGHDEGVIHRDLKPGNIMVGDYGMVTVMDWGLAKILTEPGEPDDGLQATEAVSVVSEAVAHESGADPLTVAGTILGTPNYLAPEQARGDLDHVDKRTDVFGLGANLCEILTGSALFADTDTVVLGSLATASDTAAALARLNACGAPRPLVDLAKRCLAVDPSDRPADARQVAEEMTHYLESGQRLAEQQLVQFFELSVDLFCIASLTGYFRRINDNFARLLGYSTDELLSKAFHDFVHPDDVAKSLAELDRLARGGEPMIQFLNRYRHADGHYLWLEWNARSVPHEGLIYAVARDVSDRMAAAESHARLEQEHSRLAAIVDHAEDTIVSKMI